MPAISVIPQMQWKPRTPKSSTAATPQLLALLEGLVLNEPLQPATRLSQESLFDSLRRFFATC